MLEMCPQADAVTLRERGRQAGKEGGAKGCAVIISGKRDFKYFMLLKLAAKKKSRKIQQSKGGGNAKGQQKGDALRLSWLPTGNAPTSTATATSTSTLASSSACTSRTRAVTKRAAGGGSARVWQAT